MATRAEGERLREAGAWWNLIKKRCASRQGKVVNPRTGAGNEKDLSMKRTAVVALCLSNVAASAATPAPVTLMVDDVPVTQVLQALAGQEKHNLVISPDVSGTLSLHLVDVPWKQALNTVIASAGLTLREGNILYVHSATGSSNSTMRVRRRWKSKNRICRWKSVA
jgi:type II secretory pathway component HofQ